MNKNEHLLVVLSEESSEIIKDVAKSLRFGLESIEPGQNYSNGEKIENEIADFLGVVEMLQELNMIGEISKEKIKKKKIKVEKYLKLSETLGTLKKQDND